MPKQANLINMGDYLFPQAEWSSRPSFFYHIRKLMSRAAEVQTSKDIILRKRARQAFMEYSAFQMFRDETSKSGHRVSIISACIK